MAERRIRREAGEAVRPAALHAQDQLARRLARPRGLVDRRQHRRDLLQPPFDDRLGPAGLLDTEADDRLSEIQLLVLQVAFDLGEVRLLAPETDEDHAADVRVRRVVGERPQHHLDVRSVGAAAPACVRDCHDAVHVRKSLALVDRELGHHRDLLRLVARAHARRHDQQEVARADAAVRAAEAQERAALGVRDVPWRLGPELGRQLAHDRDFVAHRLGRDGIALEHAARGADRLAVLQHELARRDRSRGEAVTRRHGAAKRDLAAIGQAQDEALARPVS